MPFMCIARRGQWSVLSSGYRLMYLDGQRALGEGGRENQLPGIARRTGEHSVIERRATGAMKQDAPVAAMLFWIYAWHLWLCHAQLLYLSSILK